MKALKTVNTLSVKETKWIKKKMAMRQSEVLHSRSNPQAQHAILSSAELTECYWFHFQHSVCWFSSEPEDRCSSL